MKITTCWGNKMSRTIRALGILESHTLQHPGCPGEKLLQGLSYEYGMCSVRSAPPALQQVVQQRSRPIPLLGEQPRLPHSPGRDQEESEQQVPWPDSPAAYLLCTSSLETPPHSSFLLHPLSPVSVSVWAKEAENGPPDTERQTSYQVHLTISL